MNLPALATKLQELGIMGKAFVDLSRDEAVALVEACWGILEQTDARRMPYWRGPVRGAVERELCVPFDSPDTFKTWLHEDGWLRMYRLLEMMGAEPCEFRRYLGRDWMERMKKRTQFKHNPCCPVCGGAINKEKAA